MELPAGREIEFVVDINPHKHVRTWREPASVWSAPPSTEIGQSLDVNLGVDADVVCV